MIGHRTCAALLGAGLLAACFLGAGCSTDDDASEQRVARKPSDGRVKIFYIQKQADQGYFIDEAAGAREAAVRNGRVDLTFVDVASDAAMALKAVDDAIAQKADAIAIVVPDQEIGPQVIEKARAADVALLASDDVIKDSSGAAAPFVGFDSTLMGQKVGEEIARIYRRQSWRPTDTKIIAAWKQDLSGCTNRVEGTRAAFFDAVTEEIPVIELNTDNTPDGAERKAGPVIDAEPRAKRWIVWGCNDENTSGVVAALRARQVAARDIITVAIGAYLTCLDWKSGVDNGKRAALFIDGTDVGASAVDALVAKVRDGTDLPPKTIAKTTMVDKTNWAQTGMRCG